MKDDFRNRNRNGEEAIKITLAAATVAPVMSDDSFREL